jgi:hypothetical protein
VKKAYMKEKRKGKKIQSRTRRVSTNEKKTLMSPGKMCRTIKLRSPGKHVQPKELQ